MLWMSLALAARIETYDASSSEMVEALAEAGDAGAADIRACGWGWASMDVTVDGRGTTVSRVNGSTDSYTACVTARVRSWDVMVLDGTARLFVEANQDNPAARKDRPLTVSVLSVKGLEEESLEALIQPRVPALNECQALITGDSDFARVKITMGPRENGWTAFSDVPGPVGRCVEREFQALRMDESVSAKVQLDFGKEPSINSLLGPGLAD